MDAAVWVIELVLLILPAYFANSIPVLLGGGSAIDGGRKMADGNRVFGDGKTVRGFFAGVLAGAAVGALEGALLTGTSWDIYAGGGSAFLAQGAAGTAHALAGGSGALQAWGAAIPGALQALGAGGAAYVLAGLLLGCGAMAGDLLGSFIKRRQGLARGKPSLVMDQLLFLALALLFVYPLAQQLLTVEAVLFLAVLTYFVHVGANVVANRLGLKKVPW
ncbi:MAG: CDP-2,3-bis-(O-geranylgeranyl)-sn-glycerol synthase [Candidatus Micrarchaeota archaeon]|nr:CDP-2,3-bis-(O-geranylgeranyl)-sn-glycerol synthase [Candidatus Micrarchaeota archaeon]